MIRRRLSITNVLVALFLAAQLTVAVGALALPRPARFSWQMYSGIRTQAEFIAVYGDGSEQEIDPADYLGNPRLDIDFSETLPVFVCEREPDVTMVRAEEQLRDEVTEYPCS